MTENSGQDPKKNIQPGEDPHVLDQAERHQLTNDNLAQNIREKILGQEYSTGQTLPDVNQEPAMSEEEASRLSRINMLREIILRYDKNYQFTGQETLEELEAIRNELRDKKN